MNDYEKLCEKQISSTKIFDGEILHVRKDNILLPNGEKATRELINHIGAVCIVPITQDGKVIMERQFRYPIDSVVFEIPAGKLDSKEEDRLLAAKRELREETGYTAKKWTDIGLFYPAPAYSDEKITMYLAEELEKGEQDLDEDEFLDLYEVPLDELVRDILAGKITDGKTQVALLKVKAILDERKNS